MSPRIALATCKDLPELDPDDHPLIRAFAEVGAEATPAIWSDPGIDWDAFDLVIIRNTWDYTDALPEFLSWVKSLGSRSRNSFDTIQWNANKTYLRDLATVDIEVIPTQFVEPGQHLWEIPDSVDYVVKPSVSAGSRDTRRFAGSQASQPQAQELIDAIHSTGKTVMIQPYLDSVDLDGETALLYINGRFSHAIRKGPLLQRDVEAEFAHGLFVQEVIDPRVARADQLLVGGAVLDLVSREFGTPLYARVDLIDHTDGKPMLLELELVEPSLFFATAPASLDRFVEAALP